MTVNYFSDDEGPFELPMASVFAAISGITELGLADEFIKACNEQKLSVSADAALINFTKQFIADNEPAAPEGPEAGFAPSAASIGRRRVRECRHPWECDA